MNFILDIGNVLINFQPEALLHKLIDDPLVVEKMYQLIFKGEEWVRLDRGDITQQEASEYFCLREPQYREIILQIMERIPEMMTPIPETVDLLTRIKASGHKLYYLSNYHATYSRYILNEYSFFGLFDGGVFSCDIHMLKPSPEFYRYLLNKYNLDPRNCLFVDDVERNVQTAETLGMQGVVFTGAQSIAKFL